jgi:hypothetical protein
MTPGMVRQRRRTKHAETVLTIPPMGHIRQSSPFRSSRHLSGAGTANAGQAACYLLKYGMIRYRPKSTARPHRVKQV